MQNSTQEIADLQKTVNAIKITKVRADRNKPHIGKEWRLYAQ